MKSLKFSAVALAITATVNMIAMPTAWAKTEWTHAKIVKIDAATANVVLKHQRIKSINMAAMTMPFKVADVALLGAFKVGDAVRFTFKQQDDRLVIDAMEKTK